MGAADERTAAEGLLCERAARLHVGRRARSVRHLFRDDRGAGVRVERRRRQLDPDRRTSARRAVRRGADPVIRVVLPQHLRTLARVGDEVQVEVDGRATTRAILDALEARYPVLQGTIRDHVTLKRRPYLRFFACEEDLSHDPPDRPLPEAIASGKEPFLVIGAMAGG